MEGSRASRDSGDFLHSWAPQLRPENLHGAFFSLVYGSNGFRLAVMPKLQAARQGLWRLLARLNFECPVH